MLTAVVLAASAAAASPDAQPKAFSRSARAGDVYPLRTRESVIASRRVASSGGAVLYVYKTLGSPALTCMRLVYKRRATGYCNPTVYTFAGDTNAFVDDIASRHPRLQAVAYGANGKMLGGTIVEGTSFR